jgi:hypothetical protein
MASPRQQYIGRVTMGFEPGWSVEVCQRLDELFAAAQAGFSRSLPASPTIGWVGDMLWEAEPLRFHERYPDSGIAESYGPQWPAPCIDYWVYVDVASRRATISTEGWNAGRKTLPLSGKGTEDAEALRGILAGILRIE